MSQALRSLVLADGERLCGYWPNYDRHPRHHDRPGFTLLAALELLGDDLIAPGHRLADAAKAELLE
jgi:hypothetical protein